MRSNIKPENRRLLEAIEYIDEDIVLGVLGELKDPAEKEVHGEYKKPSPFKHWKQLTALAACLLLLSAAFPVLNYAVQRFGIGTWEGNAGAGTSELETPTPTETEALETEAEIIDSPYPRTIDAYPADMSIKAIYDDVQKGGWVVMDWMTPKSFIAGEGLWADFISKIDVGESASILIADYLYYYIDSGVGSDNIRLKDRMPTIYLMEIVYDGKFFSYKRLDCNKDIITDEGEYSYLITDIYEYNDTTVSGKSVKKQATVYCLTNDKLWTYESFYDALFNEEELTKDFINNPCQIVASKTEVIGEVNEFINISSFIDLVRSFGFSEININE